MSFIAELDYGLVTILCKGPEQCELSGVVKGIQLELREDSIEWSQDCCDQWGGQLDDNLYWICFFLEIKISCKAYFSRCF